MAKTPYKKVFGTGIKQKRKKIRNWFAPSGESSPERNGESRFHESATQSVANENSVLAIWKF